jgi:transcriptional regulator with XRE-family HTH domain
MVASVPQHLAARRKRKLLSQRDLAKKAGVSVSTVALLETGRSTPKLVTIRRICDALRIADPAEVVEFRMAFFQDHNLNEESRGRALVPTNAFLTRARNSLRFSPQDSAR